MSLLPRKNNGALQTIPALHARGALEQLGGYLCPEGKVQSFLISGGVNADQRLEPLLPVLDMTVGQMPVIVLHNGDLLLRHQVYESWSAYGGQTPFWDVHPLEPGLEPLYGMTDMQLSAALRQMALRLGYTPTPRFERTVRAHLSILRQLELPNSLSALYYLCQFQDMGEFYDNIMALPCGTASAQRLWAELGTEDESGQFDLFRAVVCNLAEEAQYSGWDGGGQIGEQSCRQALEQTAVLLLEVDPLHTELLLTCLTEELRAGGNRPFLLILDGIPLRDARLLEYLRTGSCTLGILGDSVPALLTGEENRFSQLAHRLRAFVLLKHATAGDAEQLSQVLGRQDETRAEVSHGTSRETFHVFNRDRHEDVHYTRENRYRVMPETITGLRGEQAIVFLTDTDQVIYYN